ncbi:MAG: AhpC/TSA family protein [Bacteroidia bacterium]|nr:AhpC/TSA family protein [Bacteroidia bacterium]
MKKIFIRISVILLVITTAICCTANKNQYNIKGTINGMEEGTQLEMRLGSTHKNEQPFATATYGKEGFQFTGTLEGPRKVQINVAGEPGYMGIQLFAEPGETTITADAKVTEGPQGNVHNYSNVVISGSNATDLYSQKTEPKKLLNQIYENNQELSQDIMQALNKARQEQDDAKIEELQKSEAYQEMAAREKSFFDTVGVVMTNMILDNAFDWWGPFLMLDQMSYFTKEQEVWWNQFSNEAKNSFYGQLVKEELFPEGFVGKQAPGFTVTDNNNAQQTLSQLLDGKKYVLIDFWASWCKPCRNEIPNFKRIYQEYSSKGFDIVSISTDKNADDWKQALEEEQLPWPNFLDPGTISDLYKVKFIPSTFLVDQNGKVVAENIKGQELEQKLKELLD